MSHYIHLPIQLLSVLIVFSNMANAFPQLLNMYQQPMYQMQMDSISPIVPINSMYPSAGQLVSRTPYNPYNDVSSYGGSYGSRTYGHQHQRPFLNHPFQNQQQLHQQQQESFRQFHPFEPMPIANPYNQFPTSPASMAIAQQQQHNFYPNGRRQILSSDIPLEVVVGRQMGNSHQMSSIQDLIGGGQRIGQQPIPQTGVDHQTTSSGGYEANPFANLGAHKQLPLPASGSSPSSASGSSPSSASGSSPSSELPVFLRGAPQEIIDEFKRIIRQPMSSYETQVQQIGKLVERLDGQTQALYKEFMTENDEKEKNHRDRVHKAVSAMSEKAQEQFAKISAILRNPNEPDQNRWEKVLQMYAKMEPELRTEFEQKFKGFGTINDRPLK